MKPGFTRLPALYFQSPQRLRRIAGAVRAAHPLEERPTRYKREILRRRTQIFC